MEYSTFLPARPPFDAAALLSFLAGDAATGIEEIVDRTYRRTMRFPGGPGLLSAAPTSAGVGVHLELAEAADIPLALQRVRHIFDLDIDPLEVAGALSADPLLTPLVTARPGLRLPGHDDPFELAVRTILGQQVSVVAARTQAARLVARYGELLPEPSGSLTHLFPTPEALADAVIPVPRVRAEAIRALARAVVDGLDLSWQPPGSPERCVEVPRTLLTLPGVGPWTASYVRLRGLGDPDVFLEGDLVARKGLSALGVDASTPGRATARARCWAPWRSYALMHVWYSLGVFNPA